MGCLSITAARYWRVEVLRLWRWVISSEERERARGRSSWCAKDMLSYEWVLMILRR